MASWRSFERFVAGLLGGKVVRDRSVRGFTRPDVLSDWAVVEAKYRKGGGIGVSWGTIFRAVRHGRDYARIPLIVVGTDTPAGLRWALVVPDEELAMLVIEYLKGLGGAKYGRDSGNAPKGES